MNSIYERNSNESIFSPFNLKVDDMEKLILINFEKDPDEVYGGFEPQFFDDDIHGRGLRVIGWRLDGFVDVYQQPGLIQDRNFDVAGKGLADLLQREMPGARFNITEQGVDVYFSFEDKLGRSVEVVVKEEGRRAGKPFDLLAPVGSASESPTALPLFFLYDFYFVRRARTRVQITIGDTLHRPDTFPIPMDGAKLYFMRYAGDTFIANWNTAFKGELSPLKVQNRTATDSQGTVYELSKQDGHYEIAKMSVENKKHRLEISFTPPVPDIICIKDGTLIEGRFSIIMDERAGSLAGEYQIQASSGELEMKVSPTGGWKPGNVRLMARLIFKMASIFRKWPMSYLWTAKITLGDNGIPTIQSGWKRK